jgi:DNA polymerase
MEHTKTQPELNLHNAPLWALWHYHIRDVHHGMHPCPATAASTIHDRQALGQRPSSVLLCAADPIQHASPSPNQQGGASDHPSRPVHHNHQETTHDRQDSVQLTGSLARSAPSFTSGSKEEALAQLAEKIRQFKEPSIAQTATNLVFGDGNPHSAIMLIGEAPGAQEDIQGKPFVGASGALLDAMMASIQLDRTQCYITNVVPWRPPFNRQPSGAEIKVFLPFLHEHIHLINPRVLICVGAVAAKAVLNLDQTLTKAQGQLLSYQNPLSGDVIPAWTLYHPAYLMRAPGQKRAAWEQLLCIRAFLAEQCITARVNPQNG